VNPAAELADVADIGAVRWGGEAGFQIPEGGSALVEVVGIAVDGGDAGGAPALMGGVGRIGEGAEVARFRAREGSPLRAVAEGARTAAIALGRTIRRKPGVTPDACLDV
jgi:hypothetical protein